MTHVRVLFDARRWMDLVPDTKNEVLVEGMGRFGSMSYAVLARTSDGALAIAYVPEVRTFKIDRSKLAGSSRAKWYDPTTGRFAAAKARTPSTSGLVEFTPPGKNSAGDEDWVLVFER
jgi:hypothetical protein